MIEWTPEELAEIAAADAEIESGFELTEEEEAVSERRDDYAVAQKMGVVPGLRVSDFESCKGGKTDGQNTTMRS